jgi:hypothetical protein
MEWPKGWPGSLVHAVFYGARAAVTLPAAHNVERVRPADGMFGLAAVVKLLEVVGAAPGAC